VYSFEDLVALRVVARLRAASVPLQAVRRALRYLKRHAHRPLNTLALVPDGKTILVLTDDPKKTVEASAQGQVVISLDVAPIRRHLEQGVSELGAPREISLRVRGKAYRLVLTPDLEAGGFTVEVPELPGCNTEGDTVADSRAAAREAISGWLEVDSAQRRRGRAATR
jgi:antitoxin HicB